MSEFIVFLSGFLVIFALVGIVKEDAYSLFISVHFILFKVKCEKLHEGFKIRNLNLTHPKALACYLLFPRTNVEVGKLSLASVLGDCWSVIS